MKIHGKVIKGPQEEMLVIPRSKIIDGETQTEDYVFIARAVLDFTEFQALLSPPKPPFILRAGASKSEENVNDSTYIKSIHEWSEKKVDWMILKSLESSPGLEWETVKIDDPKTWNNYEKELHDAGFNDIEINSIKNLAIRVNSLDETRVEEARKRFLALKAEPAAK